MKKDIERICKNCRLYDPEKGLCRVVILHEGERMNLPVNPNDLCFFEQKVFNPITREVEDFNEIQQVRLWEEDKTVKIEYPIGFFGQ